MVRVCGLLSALAAICFVQIEHPLQASRYWRTAQRAAQLFGDHQLHALIRGRRAVFTLYGDANPRAILQLADDAIDIARGIPSTATVSAHAARAQVFAQHGSPSEARAALADVESVFARLPEPVLSDRQSQWGWSEQRLRHVQSWVHSYSGRISDASEAQEAALALYPTSAWVGPAQVQLNRAACMIIAGDPSEGTRHTIRTLEGLPPHLRHDCLVRHSASLVFDALPDQALTLPVVKQARELLALPTGAT